MPPHLCCSLHLLVFRSASPVRAPRETLPRWASRWPVPPPALSLCAGICAPSACAFWALVMTFEFPVESSFFWVTWFIPWSFSSILSPDEASPGPNRDLWWVFTGIPMALPLATSLSLSQSPHFEFPLYPCRPLVLLFLRNYSSLFLGCIFLLLPKPYFSFPPSFPLSDSSLHVLVGI